MHSCVLRECDIIVHHVHLLLSNLVSFCRVWNSAFNFIFPYKLTFLMGFGPCLCVCSLICLYSCVCVCACVCVWITGGLSSLFGSDFGSPPNSAMHTETCRSGLGIKVRPGKQCSNTPKTWLSAEFGIVLPVPWGHSQESPIMLIQTKQ